MNLKSTLVVSAALLFVSAPAWADSVATSAASSRTSSFSRSDIKRLGGFKTQDGRLVDVEPDGDADDATMVSTPEPGSLGLLFTGLLCIGALTGALANRRNHSVASA
jgi:Na+(H+)/acetate symporter ActP